jgi:phosphatidylglycerophosphate synthase
MFDIQIRKRIDPWLMRIARVCLACGLSANTLTWLGFFLGIGGSVAIAFGWFGVALALIACNRLLDGLDGCVARLTRPSDVGGFLDIALDMLFYSSVPFAFAIYTVENQLPACFLIYSFLGTGSSFLAFAIISAKRGIATDKAGKKSFFYSTGLIEGTETVIFLLLICLIPQHFALLAWIFGSLCWLTTSIRIAVACHAFREPM